MKSSHEEIIDAIKYGNLSRFINHSCEPNCETQKWSVNGETLVGIVSMKDIPEGEELTFDYMFDSFSTQYQKCYCGAKFCRGFLGMKPMNEEQEREIEGNISCLSCRK